MTKHRINFFVFVCLFFLNCKQQTKMAINRHDIEDPLTAQDLQKDREDECYRHGEIWSSKIKSCVTPDVACSEQGYFFDRTKHICMTPENKCLQDGRIWLDSACYAQKEACLKQNRVWTGHACVFDQKSCEVQGPQWIWRTKTCEYRIFEEYCSILSSLPQDFQNTVSKITQMAGSDCIGASTFLKTLKNWTVPSDITNLYPLVYQTGLIELHMLGPLSTTFDPYILITLKGLEHLSLKNLNLTSVPDLTDLKHLKSLDLSQNQLTDLSFLKQTVSLEKLDVSANQVYDLTPLEGLIALKKLDLSQNPIQNLFSLRGLSSLQSLDVSKTPIDGQLNHKLSDCPRGPNIPYPLDVFCSKTNSY